MLFLRRKNDLDIHLDLALGRHDLGVREKIRFSSKGGFTVSFIGCSLGYPLEFYQVAMLHVYPLKRPLQF